MLSGPFGSCLRLSTLFIGALLGAMSCGDGENARQGGIDPVYDGSGVVVPAKVQAEDFIEANEINQDYDEQDAACSSTVQADVDILPDDDGGCVIGYTNPGEWFEYLICVPESGAFDIQLHVSTGLTANWELSVDEQSTATVAVPQTSWTDPTDVTMKAIQLSQGEHLLRFTVTTGATNFDWFAVIVAGECLNGCEGRACGTDECGNSCGTCGPDETCTATFECLDPAACAASCGEKSCGLDDCGGSCGTCADQLICTPTGQCWDNSLTPIAKHGQLSISGSKIVDEHADVTQLKGVSTQWLNYEQDYATSRNAMKWLRDNWGLSLFRIANGVEGDNGYLTDPEARLDVVRGIIDNAIANEVYVLVDWHTHEPQHPDDAMAFFGAIAAEYGDEPNIIYELFNEPLDVDWSTDLKPYHQALIDEIRQHDPDNLIVVGTPRWDQLPDEAIPDPLDDANVAYTLHFYACSHQASTRAHGEAALAAGLPIFVSEWGATNADGGTPANPGVCEDAARDWHAWLEDNDISWAAWKLEAGGDSSSILNLGAAVDGGWTDADIHGHGLLVREFMLDER
jgi:hypothetical protein